MSRRAASARSRRSSRRSTRAAPRFMSFFTLSALPRHGPWLLLALFLLVGAWFRFTGLDWDSGAHLHPDERHITITLAQVQWPDSIPQYFDAATSPLNPYNQGIGSFVYGTLPLFITKAVAGLVDKDVYDGAHLVGRFLTAALDVLTILFVFLIARRLGGLWAGALAAGLYAGAVQAIQQAHFYTTDIWVTCFATAALWWALRWQEEGRWYNLVGVSVVAGLALASKLGVAMLAFGIGAAFLQRAWRETQPTASKAPPALALTTRLLARLGGHLLLGGILVYGVLRLLLPYVFRSPFWWDPRPDERYTHDIETLRLLAGGTVDFPPSYSWALADYALFPLEQMFFWEMGWAFATIAWLGLLWGAWRIARHGAPVFVPVVVWVSVHYVYQAIQFAKPGRYFLPIYPAFAVLGGVFLCWLAYQIAQGNAHAWARRLMSYLRPSPAERFLRNFATQAGLGRLAKIHPHPNPLPRGRGDSSASDQGYAQHAASPNAKASAGENPPSRHSRESGNPSSRRRFLPHLAVGLAALVLLGTLAWAFAYTRIYTQPTTRVHASQWIYQNVPANSVLAVEHWDDGLPLRLPTPGVAPEQFRYVQLPVFYPDNAGKLDEMIAALNQADYVVISSGRTHTTLSGLPARFPMMAHYYRHLFAGSLGFAPAQAFTSYPRLFGWEINDSRAEEQFKVFDHPAVYLFRKTADYDPARVRALLAPHLTTLPHALTPQQLTYNGLLLTDAQRAGLEAQGTWSSYFNRDSIVNAAPWLVWWLAVLFLGWIAWPLLWRMLPMLPDRGYLLAKSVGLLLLAYVPFLLGSSGALTAGRAGTWLTLALLACAAAWAARRAWAPFAAFLREHRAEILISEAIFSGAFLFFLWVRLTNPDLWHPYFGGEKPMDFAHMNALVKAGQYPPYDPWFAGGYINYYYMGHQVFSTLIRLLGIVPSVAYNLVVPLVAALFAANVYTFGSAVWRQAERGLRLLAGIGAIVFAALLGNADGALQWFSRLRGEDGAAPAGLAWLGEALGNILRGEPPPGFDYWHSTRLIEGAIHEFPFFSFLYGDLHPHVLALPFTMLMPALALAFVLSYRNDQDDAARAAGSSVLAWLRPLLRFPTLPLLLLGGFVLGFLRTANTWDYPTYALLIGGAVVLVERRGLLRLEIPAWVRVGTAAVGLFLVGRIAFSPYLDHYQTFFLGVVGVDEKTPLWEYLVIHAVPLYFAAVFLLCTLPRWRATVDLRLVGGLVLLLAALGIWLVQRPLVPALLVTLALALVVALAPHAAPDARRTPPRSGKRRQRMPQSFPPLGARPARLLAGMVALAALLGIFPEFFAIEGDVGRMNTVFKFYLQAWNLLALAAAASLPLLWMRFPAIARRVLVPIGAALVLLALIYPLSAIPDRAEQRLVPGLRTLDGAAFMEEAVIVDQGRQIPLTWDLEAIRWLQDHVAGTPTVLEATIPYFRWGARVSIHTGLPTVLGWDSHQWLQRAEYRPMIEQRRQDVQTIYETADPSEALALLRQYGVDYIYLGDLERAYYTGPGLGKFEQMAEFGVIPVFRNERVTIYRIERS